MKVLRVRVESERCQGHNRCCSIAPELFEADELGNAHARGDGSVAPGLEAKAKLAQANCPEHAVRVTHE
jgi:ferredoxin